MNTTPIPENEMGRIISLSDYDLDYTSFQDTFKDLAKPILSHRIVRSYHAEAEGLSASDIIEQLF
jgi:MoxR-like ATPase